MRNPLPFSLQTANGSFVTEASSLAVAHLCRFASACATQEDAITCLPLRSAAGGSQVDGWLAFRMSSALGRSGLYVEMLGRRIKMARGPLLLFVI